MEFCWCENFTRAQSVCKINIFLVFMKNHKKIIVYSNENKICQQKKINKIPINHFDFRKNKNHHHSQFSLIRQIFVKNKNKYKKRETRR